MRHIKCHYCFNAIIRFEMLCDLATLLSLQLFVKLVTMISLLVKL